MKEKIIEVIADCIGIEAESLDINADLDDEYNMDSTEKADLARILENEFNIKVEKSSKDTWNTAKDIIAFVMDNAER